MNNPMFGNITPFQISYGPASSTSPGIVTTGTQTFAGDKTFTGNITGTGTKIWDNSGTIRATGAATPAASSGIELFYSDPTGFVQSYNRSGSAYKTLSLRGSTVIMQPSGTTSFTADTTKNTHAVPEVLKSYTVATLPAASVGAGAIAYASDAGGNGPCIAISNGTNWKRCDNTSTTVT